MKKMKRILYLALALAMSTVMAISSPLTAFANSQKQYVEDIVVVYGKTYIEAKANLDARSKKDNKTYYPVNKDNYFNNYEDSYVLVGYSITTDKSQAVTDISFMNMLGEYDTTGKYAQILKDEKARIHTVIEEMQPAFEYFAYKYEVAMDAGQDSLTVFAYDMLNKFYNDDIIDAKTGKPVTVAEMIVNSDKYTADQFDNMFLQMSMFALSAVQKYIAIGCMEDWVSTLLDLDTDDSNINYTAEETEAAQNLLQILPSFQEDIADFYEIGYTSKSPQKDVEDYLRGLNDTEKEAFFKEYLVVEDAMKSIEYNGSTLLDAFMQDTTSPATLKFLTRVVHCLPTEIASLLGNISIAEMFMYSFEDDEEGTALTNLRECVNIEEMEDASVYAGVDRSIYDAKNVAVASSAKKQIESGADSIQDTVNEDNEEFQRLRLLCYTVGVVGLVAGVSLTVIGIGMLVTKAEGAWVVNMVTGTKVQVIATFFGNFAKDSYWAKFFTAYNTVLGSAATVIGILIIIGVCVLVGLTIWKSIQLKKDTPTRTSIPKIMVTDASTEKGKHDLAYYYCAKDSDGNCADLNAGHGLQWNALYYTKDPDAGCPLTTDKVIVSANSSDVLKTDVFSPAHSFSDDTAYNVNNFSGKSSPFAFFGFSCENEQAPSGNIATAFSDSTNMLFAAGGAVVGGVLTLLVTAAAKRKKKVAEN